jgi:predicted ATP-binding protein involved in virulence
MRLELKLKEIHLQNFRLFDDLKVSFDEQLTVFISENGAGKTSLLEGIAKALHGLGAATDPTTDLAKKAFLKNILNPLDVQYLKNQGFINLEAAILQDGNEIPLDWRIEMQLNNNRLTLSLNEESVKKLSRLQKNVAQAYKLLTLESLPVIVYYGSERANKNSTQIRASTQVEMYNDYQADLAGNALNFKQFVEWFDWQTRIELSAKTPNLILQQTKSAILSLLNDVDERIFDDLFIDPSQFRNPRLMVSKLGNKLEISQLSSGEKNLFVLVSDLAMKLCFANPQSLNPLVEGQGVVLVDEIDLHLHPRWQRRILTQLQSIFTNIQWIVATHSPQILGEVQKGKIYILDNRKAHLLDFNPYGKDMNRLLDQIMGVRERNETVLKELDTYFELIERNELENALKIRQSLEQKMGTDEPLFRRADGIIKRKQLIGR